MDETDAIETLAALAQPTRLKVFRMLVGAFPDSLAAGALARKLDVPHNTMSTHLSILNRAGLISAERDGRNIQYRVAFEGIQALLAFLTRDCCCGRPEACAPLIADLKPLMNEKSDTLEGHDERQSLQRPVPVHR